MLGNLTGWLISLGISLLTLVALVLMGRIGGEPPTPFGAEAASYTIAWPVEPAPLMPTSTSAEDPAPLYARAIDLFLADKRSLSDYSKVKSTTAPEMAEFQPLLDLMVKAGRCKASRVFVGSPRDAIGYAPDKPRLSAMRVLIRMTTYFGARANLEKQTDKARDYYDASFAAGVKLFEERLCWDELDSAGTGTAAALRLKDLRPELGGQYELFNQKRISLFTTSLQKVQPRILNTRPHPGDMVALASAAGDRMWRVEAILALGRLKYSADSTRDVRAASQTIKRLVKDNDPIIRAAAVVADELTIEQFRMLGAGADNDPDQ